MLGEETSTENVSYIRASGRLCEIGKINMEYQLHAGGCLRSGNVTRNVSYIRKAVTIFETGKFNIAVGPFLIFQDVELGRDHVGRRSSVTPGSLDGR